MKMMLILKLEIGHLIQMNSLIMFTFTLNMVKIQNVINFRMSNCYSWSDLTVHIWQQDHLFYRWNCDRHTWMFAWTEIILANIVRFWIFYRFFLYFGKFYFRFFILVYILWICYYSKLTNIYQMAAYCAFNLVRNDIWKCSCKNEKNGNILYWYINPYSIKSRCLAWNCFRITSLSGFHLQIW